MWVFDGEEWTQDDGSYEPKTDRHQPERPRYDEMMPELQVVEIVPVRVPVPRTPEVFPIPTP